MRAKIKATGEIVELNEQGISLFEYARGIYKDVNGNKYRVDELEFIEENPEKDIDWEQRRYEIAKTVFHSQLTEPIVDPAENIGYINEENTIAIEIKESKEDNNGMTIDDAIKHYDEVGKHSISKECTLKNFQVRDWLIELKKYKEKEHFNSNPNSTSATDEALAKWSVSCADALIAELKKGGEK